MARAPTRTRSQPAPEPRSGGAGDTPAPLPRRGKAPMTSRLFLLGVTASLFASSPRIDAETHRFVPTTFYNTYSFAHPPALRIKPGDRVATKTIDAAGVDWNGKTAGVGPNPQTGPFFVEGAEPGDMLIVTLEKLETNRAMAYSGSLLAPYAVDPAAIASRVDREARRVTWTIDKARGVA